MIELFDDVLRFMGIILAISLAIGPAVVFVMICLYPINAERWPVWKRVVLVPVFGGLAAIVLYIVWRTIRFAAGYTASSEYPLHFVVRWFN